jgi:hypothetical protein
MSSAAVRSNTLQVPPNTAIEVVMKYTTGREVNTQYGTRVLFTTIDGEQLWLNPEEAHKIHALGLAQNEPMRIFKRVEKGKSPYWVFSRVADPQTQQRPGMTSTSAPAPTASVLVAESPRNAQVGSVDPQVQNTPAQSVFESMCAAYKVSIDVHAEAAVYAQRKGVTFRVTDESIHTCAHSVFIEYGKAIERNIREREYQARYGGAR